ncbi:unnamed protein product [Strongylus vulgaris]|uniref:Peptidase A1 domain-containing protein n=1 Tax=Strongylus vulgaris TaxID=40348 RepID=A0A3P7J802_STRVU|nr:unnamed protein product [Strongylus vulgaris]
MKGFGMGKMSRKLTYEVASDTGTSFIGGPKSELDRIASAAGAEFIDQYELYHIPCDAKPPSLNLYIGSNTYSINAANYIVQAANNFCILAVFPFNFGGYGPSWLLGDPFIRQYCNIHDMGQKRIGFAKSLFE